MKDCRKNHWSDDLYGRLMKIGCSTGCHQDPKRSFQVNGYQFPLCARCTGIPIGYLIGLLIIFWIRIPVLISIGMILVMFYDWYIQYWGIRESTNFRRCITGILYGIGVIHIVLWIITIFLKIS